MIHSRVVARVPIACKLLCYSSSMLQTTISYSSCPCCVASHLCPHLPLWCCVHLLIQVPRHGGTPGVLPQLDWEVRQAQRERHSQPLQETTTHMHTGGCGRMSACAHMRVFVFQPSCVYSVGWRGDAQRHVIVPVRDANHNVSSPSRRKHGHCCCPATGDKHWLQAW